ncbi:MAG: chorismate synthase [Nitrospirota bacterium]
MGVLRYITAGESHGKALTGIIEGIPAGLKLTSEDIDKDLRRRQGGHGRGGRMKIEADHAIVLSGVRWGKTIGSPISLLIDNKDYRNWLEGMSPDAGTRGSIPAVTRPRPGHADLAGAIKYDQQDIRNILERSSARETAMRVALGGIGKRFLSEFGIVVGSYVIRIGDITIQNSESKIQNSEENLLGLFEKAELSAVRCPEQAATKKMVRLIDRAMKEGNSLGGIFEVFVTGIPIGLGSHIQWDRRLDGRLAHAIMSIQAIKGVEIGLGFEMGRHLGSEVMDEITYGGAPRRGRTTGFLRKTNFAGGIEGGITNGMPIILRAVMKPIPTQRKPLRSVDIISKRAIKAAYERSDICAVPAAAVIGEAMAALTVADAFLEKFGGDSISETKRNYESYGGYLQKF